MLNQWNSYKAALHTSSSGCFTYHSSITNPNIPGSSFCLEQLAWPTYSNFLLNSWELISLISNSTQGNSQGFLKNSAAKEKQSFIEGRIQDLEAVLSRAQVIDVASVKSNVVRFGATVVVADNDDNKENSYQIVGDYEADIEKNKISLSSPLAKALIGKEVGDIAEFKAPSGQKSFEILEIKYI